jgi:hypothetical protein
MNIKGIDLERVNLSELFRVLTPDIKIKVI